MTTTLQESLAIADFDLREMDADAGVLGEEEFRAKWHARVADAVRGYDGSTTGSTRISERCPCLKSTTQS